MQYDIDFQPPQQYHTVHSITQYIQITMSKVVRQIPEINRDVF